jgi:hypothetical protein
VQSSQDSKGRGGGEEVEDGDGGDDGTNGAGGGGEEVAFGKIDFTFHKGSMLDRDLGILINAAAYGDRKVREGTGGLGLREQRTVKGMW